MPSAAEIALGGTGVDLVHVDNKTGTFGTEALLTIAVYALAMALLVSIAIHCRKSQRETRERLRRPIPGPYGDLGEDSAAAMDQPLLEEEDAVSEREEDDGKDKKADVQFV